MEKLAISWTVLVYLYKTKGLLTLFRFRTFYTEYQYRVNIHKASQNTEYQEVVEECLKVVENADYS